MQHTDLPAGLAFWISPVFIGCRSRKNRRGGDDVATETTLDTHSIAEINLWRFPANADLKSRLP